MSLSQQRIAAMLQACGTEQGVMPPTALYEEGWMLRLVLDWFSQRKISGHLLSFAGESRWYSEALLSTQFIRTTRSDRLAESWTHADGVIGHFEIGKKQRGDLSLKPDARQLVVIEAKMHSGLSAGTKNALDYNQAARNVACMAQTLCDAKADPSHFSSLAFVVCAPQEQIDAGVFESMLNKPHLEQTVRNRVEGYTNDPDNRYEAKSLWLEDCFMPVLQAMRVEALSWESLIEEIASHDQDTGHSLAEFYQKCLQHNRRKLLPVG